MKRIRELWNRYKYLGYDRATIISCRRGLDADNLKIVSQVSCLLMIIVAILTVFYFLFDNQLVRNIICVSGAVLMIVIFWVSRKLMSGKLKYTSKTVDVLIDIFSVVCFLVGIYLGTFAAKDALAVAPVWMFFFAILIFNRLPLQNLKTAVIAGTVFIVCSYLLKSTHNFLYDVMHAVTSIIAALFMSWSKSRMKVQNILAMNRLESLNLKILETVEEREREAALLRQKVGRDELTGLMSKKMFEEKVAGILSTADDQTEHAMVCLDLDDFKYINDGFGHLFGDSVLKKVADTFEEVLPENAIGSRFGGDEFVIFFRRIKGRKEIEKYIETILDKSKNEYTINDCKHKVSLSAGIAFYPEHGSTYSALFKKADDALYKSKEEGKCKYTVS